MNESIWWDRSAFFLFFLALFILGFALTLQPKISDDWYLTWQYQEAADVGDFIFTQYTTWTGRIWLILLSAFVLPNPVVEFIYRGLIVIEILFLIALAWYCALGHGAWRRTRENIRAMSIFGSLLWLALPARDENVAWLIGNFAYLVPALFGLAFIAWIERALTAPSVDCNKRHWHFIPLSFFSFLVGFSAGISQEQVVASCGLYLTLVVLRIKLKFATENQNIRPVVWIAGLGFLIGATVLVSAPGNYARIVAIPAPSIIEVIERMALYVPGAYFELGTEGTGKSIWLCAIVLSLLHFNPVDVKNHFRARLKRGAFWLLISLSSLLALTPATNFISLRTSFFAVLFLFIGLAAMACRAQSVTGPALTISESDGHSIHSSNKSLFTASALVSVILGCLIFVEAVASFISNASVAAEFVNRAEIVKQARLAGASGDTRPIRVPFIATQKASLTYLQNPTHDRDFLASWGKRIGRTIEHDVSEGAPLPNSFKPLKQIKFRHRE